MKKLSILFFFFLPWICFSQKIVEAEYFIDDYMTLGDGTPIEVNEQKDIISLDTELDVADLPQGFHILYLRVKDEHGMWSLPYSRMFIRRANSATDPKIISFKYIFDDLNRSGESENIVVLEEPAADINHSIDINVAALTQGPHILYLWVKDEYGMWSLPYSRMFIRRANAATDPKIVSYEYVFDDINKMGGSGNLVTLGEPAAEINHSIEFDVADLSPGPHILFMKIKDETGIESFLYKQTFIKIDDTPPAPITELAYFFVDTDANVLGIYNLKDFEPATQLDLNNYPFPIHEAGLINGNQYELHVRMIDSLGIFSHFMIDTFTFNGSTNTRYEEISQLKLYPNPAKDIIKIKFNAVEEISQGIFTIQNIRGERMIQKEFRNIKNNVFTFDISSLAAGYYVVQFENRNLEIKKMLIVVE